MSWADNRPDRGAKDHWTGVFERNGWVPMGRKSNYGNKTHIREAELWLCISWPGASEGHSGELVWSRTGENSPYGILEGAEET